MTGEAAAKDRRALRRVGPDGTRSGVRHASREGEGASMTEVDDETAEAVERMREALRGLRYGTVTAVVHDGEIVQVERTEKLRLRRTDRARG